MSDRIAVFNEGRIVQVAPPAELYEHPATAFVAGFVGTSNLLDAEAARAILGREGRFTVRPEKIRLLDPDDGTRGAASAPPPGSSSTWPTWAPRRATSSPSTSAASWWSCSRTSRPHRPMPWRPGGATCVSPGGSSTTLLLPELTPTR